MPIGTGAIQSTNVPSEAFVISPDEFNAMTTRNEASIENVAASFGLNWQKQLPQTGIISRLVFTFTGTLTVAAGGATAGARWPYGLLDKFSLSANGQNNLFSCDGLDLHALRFARNPAYREGVDTFAAAVGGGAVSAGTTDLYLSWEVPIAMDDTSLVGSLYAQSGATSLTIDRTLATAAQLFSANDSRVSISGELTTAITRYSVPRSSAEGAPLVIPDLSRLHAFNAIELPLSATGDVRLELIRSSGSLGRLFFSGQSAANTPLVATPGVDGIDAIRLEYGAAQRPYQYDPASVLLSRNNDYYGDVLPYDRIALDFVRENAPRDMVLLQGVTDLALIPTINSGVSLSGATARLVQETLF